MVFGKASKGLTAVEEVVFIKFRDWANKAEDSTDEWKWYKLGGRGEDGEKQF